ncbi:pentapeptide repeat-containing protein [Actinokineospora sp. 24-640]
MTSSPVPQPSRPDPLMAPLSKKVIAWVAAGIATATLALVVVLWWAGTNGLDGEKLVTARFDALRTGLSIGLGGGGLFALYLAWRRQHSTEIGLAQKQQDQADVARAYELQREDSVARRITELYTKAVEQLGSDKAPVRLGGLYALERLAQDHAEQRQTIVNVLCAYLRMPYTLPDDPPDTDTTTDPDLRKELTTEHRDRTQEREVRLTAQRILAHHLQPGPDTDNPATTFWSDIDLDLTGATLINFTLTNCTAHTADFGEATFTGTARFEEATFTGTARFDEVTFIGDAGFDEVTFIGDAGFDEVTFTGDARFNKATFTGIAWFDEATFTGIAWFNKATFTSDAWFNEATFTGNAWFNETTFTGNAWFNETTFTGNAWFDETTFTSDTRFDKATFTSDTRFDKATFTGNARFDEATFTGNARFDEATLPTTRYTDYVTPSPWTNFHGAHFERAVPAEVAGFVSGDEAQGDAGNR